MSVVGPSIPVVPLSQITGAQEAGAPSPAPAEQQTFIVPPAFAGQGRGFSALNFGITPPPNNGEVEAAHQELNDRLDAVRIAIEEGRAQTEAAQRLTALGVANTELAQFTAEVEELILLEQTTIPAKQAEVDQVNASITGLTLEETRLQLEINRLVAAQIGLDPQSQEAETLAALERAARADLASTQSELAVLRTQLSGLESDLAGDVQRAEELRNEAVPESYLATSLAAAAVPALTDGAEGITIDALIEALGEESLAKIVQDIIATVETNLYDVAIVDDVLQEIAADLGEIRLAKVGLAFSTIFTTLQDALNAMASALEVPRATAATLAREGETRLRLPLDGPI